MATKKAQPISSDEYNALTDQALIIDSEYLHWPGIDAENQIVWVGVFAEIETPILKHLDAVKSFFVITFRYPDTVEKPYTKHPVKTLVDAILLSRKLKRELLIGELRKMRNAIEKAYQTRESLDEIEDAQSKQLRTVKTEAA